tara:strand:- start:247 stop:1113 length:867 start_codon:yes stop_codon:yes gene_type:complete
MLLAKGDGSFQITKFALSDEEIDYSLYNKNHPSGSAYYDLEILQAPILEAFTNNGSTMKTRLQTYTNMELLFLPVLRLNERTLSNKRASNGAFMIPVNAETEDNSGSSVKSGIGRNLDGSIREGFIFGESLIGTSIKVDEGMDTTEISPKRRLDDELKETSYTVQMDNRLCKLVDAQGTLASFDYLDDDNIGYYTVDLGDTFVTEITDDTVSASEVIQGPRGTRLEFRLQSSMDLNTSSYLFQQLGGTVTMDTEASATVSTQFIDSNIRIVGIKTGVMIDVPVRFLRL